MLPDETLLGDDAVLEDDALLLDDGAPARGTVRQNASWRLEDFVDSLVLELDKTRETLGVRAFNNPLSYAVKEVSLDLNTFPSYDGEQVEFVTAQPGQAGASKITISLGSITDQQVRATTKIPKKSDVSLGEIDVDRTTRRRLRKLGVSSVGDLAQLEEKNVDLGDVTDNELDYTKLAQQIQRSRRAQTPPTISSVSLALDDDGPALVIEGENLTLDPRFPPVAVINQVLAHVLSTSDTQLRIQVSPENHLASDNEVIVTFDPYSIVKVTVRA